MPTLTLSDKMERALGEIRSRIYTDRTVTTALKPMNDLFKKEGVPFSADKHFHVEHVRRGKAIHVAAEPSTRWAKLMLGRLHQ
ncbi:hypothetical protein [Methylobacter sp.]|uniref:hypothetical protein n=1 Tax=Methylobacter sp. TaxID=2051955 RepID=UPI001207C760|nr:hypothetical protein [Methylobacter sp.]TAK59501.1 MAG: hypothetical protein EPO18_20275 [Methylobacter sp.]